jgi:hypothetical protein
VEDGTIELLHGANIPSTWTPVDACLFNSGGVNYVAVISLQDSGEPGTIQVINVDTMAQVGVYIEPNVTPTGGKYYGLSVFADNNGILWGGYFNDGGYISMVSWNPANGATGGFLNVTTPVVLSPLGFTKEIGNIGYISATNSLFVADSYASQAGGGNATMVKIYPWLRGL